MLRLNNSTSLLLIPKEMMAMIFRYTPSGDTPNLLGSGFFPWQQTNSAMFQAQMLEREKVRSFIEKLQSEWAATYPDQTAQLSSVFKKYDNEYTMAASLNSVFSMRDKIVEIFASVVTYDNVLQIEKKWHEERVKIVYSENNNDRYSRDSAAVLPRGFETFFNRLLMAVIHNIEVANNLSHLQKSAVLLSIAQRLRETGQLARALEVAERIPYDYTKSFELLFIAEELIKAGQFERIEAISKTIPDDRMKPGILQSLVEGLIKVGQLERAEVIAERIVDDYVKSCTLLLIVEDLIEAGQLERAEVIAERIPNDSLKREALRSIHRA